MESDRYGTALAYGTTGSTNLRAILEALLAGRADPRMLAVASSLLLVGVSPTMEPKSLRKSLFPPHPPASSPPTVSTNLKKRGGEALRCATGGFARGGTFWGRGE